MREMQLNRVVLPEPFAPIPATDRQADIRQRGVASEVLGDGAAFQRDILLAGRGRGEIETLDDITRNAGTFVMFLRQQADKLDASHQARPQQSAG